jgi:protein-tyrosine kinase
MRKTTHMAVSIKNTSSLPQEIRDARGTLSKHNFRLITVDLSCHFSHMELTKLVRMIETALPGTQHRVVQFVSAYKEEGASEIALETAIIAARLIGKRVLFIDTTSRLSKERKKKLSDASNISLETLLLSGGSPYEAIAQAAGTELYFAMLCEKGEEGLAPISLNAIENVLENLRPNFDLIIIDSQAILSDAFGMALAKLVDGSVMTIEAERTRAPVSAECKRLIESSGGHLIGAVMNRRRLYIPNSLYRLLYQRISI